MNNELTSAQNQLLEWIKDYVQNFHHSPSIRQMMKGMGGNRKLNKQMRKMMKDGDMDIDPTSFGM